MLFWNRNSYMIRKNPKTAAKKQQIQTERRRWWRRYGKDTASHQRWASALFCLYVWVFRSERLPGTKLSSPSHGSRRQLERDAHGRAMLPSKKAHPHIQRPPERSHKYSALPGHWPLVVICVYGLQAEAVGDLWKETIVKDFRRALQGSKADGFDTQRFFNAV